MVLEVIFLISMLLSANHYDIMKTTYETLRLQYLISTKEIIILFAMGLIAILTLMVVAVASQRYIIAAYGNIFHYLRSIK
jgi:ABC-type glycerol-3-phosphate transport system permease component